MALENFPTDLNGECVEHNHLLSSDRAGWEQLSLIYELEPAGEMPEAVTHAEKFIELQQEVLSNAVFITLKLIFQFTDSTFNQHLSRLQTKHKSYASDCDLVSF